MWAYETSRPDWRAHGCVGVMQKHPEDEHSTHGGEDDDPEVGEKHMTRNNGRGGSVIRLPPFSGFRGRLVFSVRCWLA